MTMTWYVLLCWCSANMFPLRAVFAAQQLLSLANNQTCEEDKSTKNISVTPTKLIMNTKVKILSLT